jgi:murein DD-endopeptidase MepM/ murein hydrolase activator NlpD
MANFKFNERIYTLTTVRVRRTPGFQDKSAEDVIAELPLDARGTVVAGPQMVDGLIWWQIRTRTTAGEILGWMAHTSFEGTPLIASAGMETPSPLVPTGKFSAGEVVFAHSFVNLRRTPGYVGKTSDDILVEIPYGQPATVDHSTPQDVDNLIWWRVAYTGADGQSFTGWTAESASNGTQLLSKEAPPPLPSSSPPVFKTYGIGDAVCNISLGAVNLRRSPGFRDKATDDVVAQIPSKAVMRLIEGPRQADGLFWWRVQGQDGDQAIDGWMAEVSPNGIRLLAPALFRDAIAVGVPFHGNQRVSQLWGDNPDFYRQFPYDGVPLRGHNGIDFAMPIGTPLVTVDSGRVLTVGASTGGFGNWVMVDHRWGQSVYAHMHRVTVHEGQTLERGNVLGESGNSGTSTGPHLHFSIRINPYFRADGWGGYCDPLPFMEADKLNIPAGIRGEEEPREILPPSPPPIEEPGRPLP